MNITKSSSFTAADDIDLPAATNGTHIVSFEGGNFNIFSMSGMLVKSLPNPSFYCGTLPICSAGGFNADNRVVYDTGSNRWVASGLFIDTTPGTMITDVMGVSQTSDPTGVWYLYQFPACGANYPTDSQHIGDQPHLGFNSQWIVIDTACASGYTGLTVFDKAALYAGRTFALNSNWFQFNDPVEAYNKDNPASTYTSTINNREYLTASVSGACRTLLNTECADVLYSHIEGAVDSPVFYASTDQVDTDFQWGDDYSVYLNTPTCNACLHAKTNNWTHSSGVWSFKSGQPYVLSTAVVADPRYSNGSQLVSVAISDSGVATTMRIFGGTGTGPIASEIAMPLVPNLPNDTAIIAYDWSSSTFYPGVYASQWDIDTNRLDFTNVIAQGMLAPSDEFYQDRWSDFLDAFSPIPGTSKMLLGAQIGISPSNGEYASYWATVTEAPTPAPTPRPSPTVKPW